MNSRPTILGVPAHAEDIIAMARDAARYRWLRSRHWNEGGLVVTDAANLKLGRDVPCLDRLDAAIDAQMKEAE